MVSLALSVAAFWFLAVVFLAVLRVAFLFCSGIFKEAKKWNLSSKPYVLPQNKPSVSTPSAPLTVTEKDYQELVKLTVHGKVVH